MLNGVLSNSNYLSMALALVGLVGGGFVSWIITFAYFKKAQTRKLLCYASYCTSYLVTTRGIFMTYRCDTATSNSRIPLDIRFTFGIAEM